MPRPDVPAAAGYQSGFSAALLDPAAAIPDGLTTPSGAPATRRFAVYRNNVVASLMEALAQAFPAVEKLVGVAFFKAMAAEHVRAYPPRSPVMLEYGQAFPAWVDQFEPAAGLPYLGDVARLELARRRAYHAADAAPLTRDGLQRLSSGLDPDAVARLRLTPHPALQLLETPHPALSLWRLAMAGGGGAAPAGPERIAVARPTDRVTMTTAAPGAFAFLRALAAGETIADAAEAGTRAAARARAETGAGQPFELGAALSGALEAGFLVAPGGSAIEISTKPRDADAQ